MASGGSGRIVGHSEAIPNGVRVFEGDFGGLCWWKGDFASYAGTYPFGVRMGSFSGLNPDCVRTGRPLLICKGITQIKFNKEIAEYDSYHLRN